MKENREKRERLRKRLIHQKQLAEEKLQEEQERMEMAGMESEIKQINERRSVHVSKNLHVKVDSSKNTCN